MNIYFNTNNIDVEHVMLSETLNTDDIKYIKFENKQKIYENIVNNDNFCQKNNYVNPKFISDNLLDEKSSSIFFLDESTNIDEPIVLGILIFNVFNMAGSKYIKTRGICVTENKTGKGTIFLNQLKKIAFALNVYRIIIQPTVESIKFYEKNNFYNESDFMVYDVTYENLKRKNLISGGFRKKKHKKHLNKKTFKQKTFKPLKICSFA